MSLGAGQFEQGTIAEEVRDAELWRTGLACAEELAGTALLEIELGEREAVGGRDEGVEARFGGRGDAIAGDEEAVAFPRASADAAAELVEL